MPRRPRLFLPNQPQHLVVRGHNRDPILLRREDFRFLYRCLQEASGNHSLTVHAWVFMHNHIHLLATPEDEQSLPRSMQSVGRRYAQYFNRRYHRSGSLWEGRYKSGLVDTDRYLLACYRYIELNPVRAGVVPRPEDYPYSSYHANALGKADALVTPHSIYLELISGGVARGVGVERDPVGNRLDESHVELSSRPLRHRVDSDPGDKAPYVALFDQELSRKQLTEIRRGTEKGIGIGIRDRRG